MKPSFPPPTSVGFSLPLPNVPESVRITTISKPNFTMYNYTQFLKDNPDYAFQKPIHWQDLSLDINQASFDLQCQEVAKLVDRESVNLINKPSELLDFSYPKNSLNFLDTNLSIMRLSFVVDQNKQPRLIEINSQTPSFFWECHDGLQDCYSISDSSTLSYKNTLIKYLQNQIDLINIKLNRVTKPRVGLVCCDHPDDLFQMQYIQTLLDSTNSASYSEVLTIQQLDISSKNTAFSTVSNKEFDALLFWYPIEWLAVEKFADGSTALDSIFELVKQNNLQIINGMQSFVVQNKEFLASLYETVDPLPSIFVPSFYTLKDFQKQMGNVDYIAKPVFGREGQGIFGQKDGASFEGDLSDSYYTDQNYIYQPLIQGSNLTVDNQGYKYTLEKWVVKIDGNWQPAGQSLRVNEAQDLIVNNTCKWLPLI
jgi:glutathionylspermidine synthase